METISAEYLLLFNEISRTIEELEGIREKLMAAQQKAEEMYIESNT